MIVVDTNTIVYLYFPSSHTTSIEGLRQADEDWVAPLLWRSEFRNVLASYVRRQVIDLATACEIQSEAEVLMMEKEFELPSRTVLEEAHRSGCSGYDCEFISLARVLDTVLITGDRKILQRCPEIATTAANYLK